MIISEESAASGVMKLWHQRDVKLTPVKFGPRAGGLAVVRINKFPALSEKALAQRAKFKAEKDKTNLPKGTVRVRNLTTGDKYLVPASALHYANLGGTPNIEGV